MKSLFITFEGGEGCGKSTQVELLSQRLTQKGARVLALREPGGTALGEAVRHLLKFDPAGRSMVPEAELLLFTASRAQVVREVIQPALREGITVICDRFSDSTIVYQGMARGLGEKQVKLINDFAIGACQPDLTFLLDLPVEEGKRRLMRRVRPLDVPDRMESEPLEFYEKVRQGYLELARSDASRFRIIDASGSKQMIHETIWNEVSHALE